MRDGLIGLPYSKKSLKALAETLKIHSEMIWIDPLTNSFSIKQVDTQDELQGRDPD